MEDIPLPRFASAREEMILSLNSFSHDFISSHNSSLQTIRDGSLINLLPIIREGRRAETMSVRASGVGIESLISPEGRAAVDALCDLIEKLVLVDVRYSNTYPLSGISWVRSQHPATWNIWSLAWREWVDTVDLYKDKFPSLPGNTVNQMSHDTIVDGLRACGINRESFMSNIRKLATVESQMESQVIRNSAILYLHGIY